MPQINFAAQAYQARSQQLISQECINAFVENSPKDAKTMVPVFGTAGLSLFSRLGNGPINGMHVFQENLYAVSDGALFAIDQFGNATLIGQTNLGGILSIADNGQQMIMVDGSAGWIYQPTGLNQVTTANAVPLSTLTVTIGGSPTTGDSLIMTVSGVATSGTVISVPYTVPGSATLASVASGIASAVVGNSVLANAGVAIVSVTGPVITFRWPTSAAFAWGSSVPVTATETITISPTTNTGASSVAANVTGTVTAGDTLTVPLDDGGTFTTTAAQTVVAADAMLYFTDPLPSNVTAGAVIVDPTNILAQIIAPAWKSANTVTFFDGYFVFDAAGTRQFFISGINDGTQYSGLDFATASASSRNVVAVRAYHEQLLVFTEGSTEVWWDTGNVNFPFQRYDAAYIERGCAAPLSMVSEDNTVFWMGDDGIFYRLNGFLPMRISTFAMEHAWQQYENKFFDCNAFELTQEGHKFIILNFSSGPATWCFDISVGLWHRRESQGSQWV